MISTCGILISYHMSVSYNVYYYCIQYTYINIIKYIFVPTPTTFKNFHREPPVKDHHVVRTRLFVLFSRKNYKKYQTKFLFYFVGITFNYYLQVEYIKVININTMLINCKILQYKCTNCIQTCDMFYEN